MDEIVNSSVEKQIQIVLKQGQTFAGVLTPRVVEGGTGGAIREMLCGVPNPAGPRAAPQMAKLYFRTEDIACILIVQEPSAITMPPGNGGIIVSQ